MGNQHAWAGKLFHLLLALFVALSSVACAMLEDSRKVIAQSELRKAHRLFDEGDHASAIAAYERAFDIAGKALPADEALMFLGLVYTDPEYQNQDVSKALEYWNRIARDVPDSVYIRQAKILSSTMQSVHKDLSACLAASREHEVVLQRQSLLREPEQMLRQKKYDASAREYLRISDLMPKTPEGEKALFMTAVILSHPNNPNKNYSHALDAFSRLIREYPDGMFREQASAWIGTIKAIEALKSIDVNFKERKRYGR